MFHFPEINPGKNELPMAHYLEHIADEIAEFKESDEGKFAIEEQAKEVVDILHASETFARKWFAKHSLVDFNDIKRKVMAKNIARGYYK